jgi:hemoglobin
MRSNITRPKEPNHLARPRGQRLATAAYVIAAALGLWLVGCRSKPTNPATQNFFTSGSTAADQRAQQRMARAEQLAGSSASSSGKKMKASEALGPGAGEAAGAEGTNTIMVAPKKLALYYRLGGEVGLSNLVADFLARAMDDPRVNWDRKGVTRGGLSFHRGQSETWKPTPQNVALLQKHMVEFLALATGGPSHYTGREIESVHAHMHISNPEFDATVGDLKVSLDRLKIANVEQRELLAIIESTRPEIVTER